MSADSRVATPITLPRTEPPKRFAEVFDKLGMSALVGTPLEAALRDRGVTADVVHPSADLTAYKVVVVPTLYLVDKSGNIAAGYVDPYVGGGTKDFAPYVLMIVALMVRPYGIFGKKIIERV